MFQLTYDMHLLSYRRTTNAYGDDDVYSNFIYYKGNNYLASGHKFRFKRKHFRSLAFIQVPNCQQILFGP